MLPNILPRTYPHNKELSGLNLTVLRLRNPAVEHVRSQRYKSLLLSWSCLGSTWVRRSSQRVVLVCDASHRSLTLHLSTQLDCKPFEAGTVLTISLSEAMVSELFSGLEGEHNNKSTVNSQMLSTLRVERSRRSKLMVEKYESKCAQIDLR